MKKLVLSIVISTCMISQVTTPHLFAMIIDDDCNSSTGQSLVDSGDIISEICIEPTSIETSTSEISISEIIPDEVASEILPENIPDEVIPENISSEIVPVIIIPEVVASQGTILTQSSGNNSTNRVENTSSESIVMSAAPDQEIITDSTEVVVPEIMKPNILAKSIISDEEGVIINVAPIEEDVHINTPWVLIHNIMTISGFTWSGLIANYFTPIVHNDSN